MKFRICFPVDAGEKSFIVFPYKHKGRNHYVKGFKSHSGLKPNSGSEFVYNRLSHNEQENYAFCFDIKTEEKFPENTTPHTLFGNGQSDALACALSFFQENEDEMFPIVSISCSLNCEKPDISCASIERVGDGSSPDETLASLKNKYNVSLKNKALALILHEEDAKLFRKHPEFSDVEIISLDKNHKINRKGKTYIISCKKNQIGDLCIVLGITKYHISIPFPFDFNLRSMLNLKLTVKITLMSMIFIFIYLMLFSNSNQKTEITSNIENVDNTDKYLKINDFQYLGEVTYQCNGVAIKVKEYWHIKTGLVFALIPGGSYQMGHDWKIDYEMDERPVHLVNLDSFLISRTEITQKVWKDIMKTTPWSKFQALEEDSFPATYITWYEAEAFCESVDENIKFRLPTEAEWEYACRAGRHNKHYWGDGNGAQKHENTVYCWFKDNSGLRVHSVKGKKENAFGLYDMSGNVWEWCSDWYQKDYYSESPILNPKGPKEGTLKVVRGGGFDSTIDSCRSANRISRVPDIAEYNIGFRICLSVSSKNENKEEFANINRNPIIQIIKVEAKAQEKYEDTVVKTYIVPKGYKVDVSTIKDSVPGFYIGEVSHGTQGSECAKITVEKVRDRIYKIEAYCGCVKRDILGFWKSGNWADAKVSVYLLKEEPNEVTQEKTEEKIKIETTSKKFEIYKVPDGYTLDESVIKDIDYQAYPIPGFHIEDIYTPSNIPGKGNSRYASVGIDKINEREYKIWVECDTNKSSNNWVKATVTAYLRKN